MSRLSLASSASSNPDVEKTDFRFKILNIRQLITYTSTRVYVNGLPWQVKLKRYGDNVAIELCCNYSNPNTNWSCAARAIFKLISFSPTTELYEKRQDAVAVFSSKLPSITRHQPLVTWQELFEPKRQYVSNNAIIVDVTIQAEKLRDSSQSRLIVVEPLSGQSTYRFKLMKVKGVIAMDSPEFLFRNIKCHLTVTKRYPLTRKELAEDKYGYLGIWLASTSSVDTSEYDIQVLFRLMSPNGQRFEKYADQALDKRFNFSSRLMPLHVLYNNSDYMHNDSLTLEVDVKVEHIINNSKTDNINSNISNRSSSKTSSIVMECILCYDNMINQAISSTPCGHLFCRKCIIASLQRRSACPVCNANVVADDIHDIFLPSIHQIE